MVKCHNTLGSIAGIQLITFLATCKIKKRNKTICHSDDTSVSDTAALTLQKHFAWFHLAKAQADVQDPWASCCYCVKIGLVTANDTASRAGPDLPLHLHGGREQGRLYL